MTFRNLITLSPLFSLLIGAAGCDVDDHDHVEPLQEVLGDEVAPCDATALAVEADEADADDAERWTPADTFELPARPPEGPCDLLWQEFDRIDNACGSCTPQPNMPGRQTTVKSRWCWSCGQGKQCENWVVNSVWCAYC